MPPNAYNRIGFNHQAYQVLMVANTTLSASFSVTGQLAEADFQALAQAGYRTVINFRPDSEVPDQLASHDAERAAHAAGLVYVHIPAGKFNLFAETLVADTAHALAAASGPVLGYCGSGQRAAIVWAAATARVEPVDSVLATLKRAGYDLAFLRDDLEAQAGRIHWDVEHAPPLATHQKPEMAAA